MEVNIKKHVIKEGEKVNLKNISTEAPKNAPSKEEAKKLLKEVVREIGYYQNILYAENKQSLLVIFQGIDASGKDSSIRAVMTGVNPQGVEVYSFKSPTAKEYEYNYLWRHMVKLPEKGKIGIFNRSHYENVMICKVHPEYIMNERLPNIVKLEDIDEKFFTNRYEEINQFEKGLVKNGTQVIKFFLNISKKEQKKRFLNRIEEKEKNWKFSIVDLKERDYWEEYQKAYQKAFTNTSTKHAPWYVIPCDNKAYGQLVMGSIILKILKKMSPQFPKMSKKEEKELYVAYEQLKGR